MRRYISTRHAIDRPSRALLFSVVAHVVFFAAVLTAKVTTATSGGALVRTDRITERIRFVEAAPVAPAQPVRAATKPTRAVAQPFAKPIPKLDGLTFNVPNMPEVVGGIDTPLPSDLDFTNKVTDSLDFGPVKSSSVIGEGKDLLGGFGTPTNGVYSADMVERMVMPMPNNPKPVYPSMLLSAGIEGQFVVHFVVDTNGRVDEKSMEFPPSAHRLFVDAVRRALKRSKYRPAEVGGQRVAQRVEQQFTFRIQRERW